MFSKPPFLLIVGAQSLLAVVMELRVSGARFRLSGSLEEWNTGVVNAAEVLIGQCVENRAEY